jgi:hypothetical protein
MKTKDDGKYLNITMFFPSTESFTCGASNFIYSSIVIYVFKNNNNNNDKRYTILRFVRSLQLSYEMKWTDITRLIWQITKPA